MFNGVDENVVELDGVKLQMDVADFMDYFVLHITVKEDGVEKSTYRRVTCHGGVLGEVILHKAVKRYFGILSKGTKFENCPVNRIQMGSWDEVRYEKCIDGENEITIDVEFFQID